jgi:hypothetical protein
MTTTLKYIFQNNFHCPTTYHCHDKQIVIFSYWCILKMYKSWATLTVVHGDDDNYAASDHYTSTFTISSQTLYDKIL